MPTRIHISKILIIASGLLFFSAQAIGECVEVSAGPQPSSQTVRIATLVNGSPASDIRVVISGPGPGPNLALVTNKNGITETPILPPGVYNIVAASSDAKLRGELILNVSRTTNKRVDSFSLALLGNSAQAQPNAQQIANAGKLPISARVRQFGGVLRDPSGAQIPGGQVWIFSAHSPSPSADQAVITTKQDGHFSDSLPDGTYVAFFQAPGFRTEVIAIEITGAGSEELKLTLQVGGC